VYRGRISVILHYDICVHASINNKILAIGTVCACSTLGFLVLVCGGPGGGGGSYRKWDGAVLLGTAPLGSQYSAGGRAGGAVGEPSESLELPHACGKCEFIYFLPFCTHYCGELWPPSHIFTEFDTTAVYLSRKRNCTVLRTVVYLSS